MGNIVGGVIGGIGSLLGGSSAKSNALTGYNYLAGNKAIQAAQGATAPSLQAQDTALQSQTGAVDSESLPIAQQNQAGQMQGAYAAKQGGVGDTINSLLTGGPGGNAALHNYLNSTGYGFQLDQGTRAIGGSAAARGLLNSGSTAKGLATFGQGLAGNYFNNYVNQLGTAANTYGNTAQSYGNTASTYGNNASAAANQATGYGNVANTYGSRAQLGVNAAGAVGQAGTQGGETASKAAAGSSSNFFGNLAGIASTLLL